MTSKKIKIAILAVIALVLAVTPSASSLGGFFLSQEVKAQTSTSGSFSGSGAIGSYTCPSGVKKSGLSISFGATGQSGSWSISGKSGKVTSVPTNNGLTYTARGLEMVNTLCFGAPLAQSIEISGNCGSAKQISYKENDNLKSTFTGNVNCNSGSACSSGSAATTSTSTSGSTATACSTSTQPASCQTSGSGTATATSGSTTVACPK